MKFGIVSFDQSHVWWEKRINSRSSVKNTVIFLNLLHDPCQWLIGPTSRLNRLNFICSVRQSMKNAWLTHESFCPIIKSPLSSGAEKDNNV